MTAPQIEQLDIDPMDFPELRRRPERAWCDRRCGPART
jgi:hypothetical protein